MLPLTILTLALVPLEITLKSCIAETSTSASAPLTVTVRLTDSPIAAWVRSTTARISAARHNTGNAKIMMIAQIIFFIKPTKIVLRLYKTRLSRSYGERLANLHPQGPKGRSANKALLFDGASLEVSIKTNDKRRMTNFHQSFSIFRSR